MRCSSNGWRCARPRLSGLLALVLWLTAGCTQIERLALPSPGLVDAHWTRHAADSDLEIDHTAWDRFLALYVTTDATGVNRIDYGRVSAAERAGLDGYLMALASVPVDRLSGPEQLAFWVNLYNARTVALVLDHYPVDSIRDITFTIFGLGPWDEPLVDVGGRRLTLNQIEHGIIRPIWRDQRVHYVLSCAAVGCPNLGKSAYTGDNIDRRMDMAARAYVNSPRGVWINPRGRLFVSKIYGWFREDFGGDEAAVIRSIRRYANLPLADRLAQTGRIHGYQYDWALNDAAVAP